MSKKATLVTVSSGYNSNTVINSNLNAINDKLDNTLSLDGSTPNSMGADLDMDSNSILNIATLDAATIRLNGSPIIPSEIVVVESIAVKKEFLTVANLLADTGTYTDYISGDYFRVVVGNHTYLVLGSGATDQHLTTAGGVKLSVVPVDGAYHVEAFGTLSAETDNARIQRVIDFANTDDIRKVVLAAQSYTMMGGVSVSHSCDLVGTSRNATMLVAGATFTSMITLDHVFASVSNLRLKGENTVTNGIRIEAQGTANCDIRISDLLMEKFATDIYSLGSDGIHVERVQSRLATVQFFKSDDNCLNSTFDNIYALTATGGDGLIFNKSTQQVEGLTVTNCHFLTPSGKGLRMQAALACHFTNVIFDQQGEPLDLDFSGGSDAGLGLSFHGCWFNGKTGNGAVNIQGNPNAIAFHGCTFAHTENYGIQIGASVQNLTLMGCLFQSAGTTASSIGIVQLGAKGVRVIGCSFNGYTGSAKNVSESAGSVTIYDMNRFSPSPTYGTDIVSTSLVRTNFGIGSSPSTGDYTLFLDDGAAATPSLAFMNDQDAGFYKTGNGFAMGAGGVGVAEVRSTGLYQVAGRGWFGAEVNVGDDAVFSFTPPASSGILTIRVDIGSFEVEYRAVGGLARCAIISASVIASFAATTGALTGTTGTDTQLTVSAHTDGSLYIENRLGSSKTVNYSVRV